ncbi:MAG: DNA-processing protein DprA [Treponema sp.]|jgi:DNA processing protein|nr:DNA-processing protein DprA [Treponema sp.]
MIERGLLDFIITLLPGLTPRNRVALLNGFDCEEDIILQSKEDLERYLNRQIRCDWDIDEIRAKAAQIERICRMRSINLVSWNDAAYPPLLREIYDPPAVLFYKGELPNPEKPLLGMVGTRRPSPESAQQAYKIAYDIGRAGFSVISGLALGIDAMSHRGNLAGGAAGYAVLGSGPDEIYPSSNRMLARRILESGGALISEYPPGTHPERWHFPARNRLISALSRSVLIVEAPQKSGSLITAAFALEHGKELWVASTGLQEHQYSSLNKKMGTIKLAGDGAEIIYSFADILEKWNFTFADNDNDDGVVVPQSDVYGNDLVSSMANFLEIEF